MIPTISKSSRKLLCDSCRAKFPVKTPSLFAKQLKKQRKEKQEQERLTKKGEAARIREECGRRSREYCECGCGVSLLCRIAELDHYFGRARERQTVENCWLLLRDCHVAKTQNIPTRRFWDALWHAHCTRYGYPYRERFGGRPQADARNEPPDSVSDASFALGAQEGEK